MNLLASSAWILDVAFILILLLGILFGTWAGFIRGVCKLAGTIFAIFVALTFCNAFKNSLESAFGLTSAIASGVGETIANWLSIAISAVLLFLIVKLGAWLLGKIGTALVDKIGIFRAINRVLGGLLGLLEALMLIFLLLTICYWINVDAVNTFIGQSSIVKAVYEWDWFQWAAQFNFLK
ncbi:MAG TPA: CvpA family protein [Firmicutes bacterium]|nr:CvpA family protein [Bacillota bacterium]